MLQFFFMISARGAPNFASSFARILIYNSHDVGAASPQVSAVLRAEKTARSAIAHFFPPENSRIRCEFSARSTRITSKLRPTSLRKHVDVEELLHRVVDVLRAEKTGG